MIITHQTIVWGLYNELLALALLARKAFYLVLMQENNITDIFTGINASMGHISITETGPREHVWSGPILRGSVRAVRRRQTERILGGRALVLAVCLSLLSGILFQLSPLRWPLLLCHRGSYSYSPWKSNERCFPLGTRAVQKLSRCNFIFKSLRTFTSRQSEKYCSFVTWIYG